MLSIAGIASPWDARDIDRFIDSARNRAPKVDRRTWHDLQTFLKSMKDGLGDGLVTVESTRLDGVEHRTVPGTHLSMIRNLTEDSRRVPPAVPLVVSAVEQVSSKQQGDLGKPTGTSVSPEARRESANQSRL